MHRIHSIPTNLEIMKNSASPTRSESKNTPSKNQKETGNYEKDTTHLKTTLHNYQEAARFDCKESHPIAFKDTLIGREIIAWHMNLKSQLFDSSTD